VSSSCVCELIHEAVVSPPINNLKIGPLWKYCNYYWVSLNYHYLRVCRFSRAKFSSSSIRPLIMHLSFLCVLCWFLISYALVQCSASSADTRGYKRVDAVITDWEYLTREKFILGWWGVLRILKGTEWKKSIGNVKSNYWWSGRYAGKW